MNDKNERREGKRATTYLPIGKFNVGVNNLNNNNHIIILKGKKKFYIFNYLLFLFCSL